MFWEAMHRTLSLLELVMSEEDLVAATNYIETTGMDAILLQLHLVGKAHADLIEELDIEALKELIGDMTGETVKLTEICDQLTEQQEHTLAKALRFFFRMSVKFIEG